MELLQPQLDATTTYFLDNLPQEANDIFQNVLDKAIANHIADNVPQEGDRLPNFQLPTATGDIFHLDEQLEKGPIVLAFYRGSWCPYCNLMLKTFQAILPEIHQLGAQLVAISPEFPEKAQATMTDNGYEFEVLTDKDNGLAEQLGLLFHQDEAAVATMKSLGFDLEAYYGKGKGFVIPVPATFVIEGNGKIAMTYANPNYRFRAEPAQVIEVLRGLV